MRKILSLFLILFSASAFAGWPSSGTTTCLTAGSASVGCINYSGTTQAAGQFDSGAVAPVHTNALNYDGSLYATNFGASAGSVASPSISLGGVNTGFTLSGAELVIASDSGMIMQFGAIATANGVRINGATKLGWTAGATNGSASDVAFSRISSGVLALGNGTISDSTAELRLGKVSSSGPSKLSNGYTVATLPAGTDGQQAFVTDALAPTYLGALTGGGTVHTPVFFNGTAWVSH